MNFVDWVLFQCRQQPPVAAMCAPGSAIGLLSYGRLEQFIANIAANATANGFARGEVVALSFEDHLLHASFVLGLGYAGIATISVQSLELPKEIDIAALITDRSLPFEKVARVIRNPTAWLEPARADPRGIHAEAIGDEICRYVLTSGTTGGPKAVAFTHQMMIDRVDHYGWIYGRKASHCSRVYVDPSLASSIGLLSWLRVITRGGTVFFRGADAVETMQSFDLYRVQCMVASAAALGEFADLYESAPAFQSGFEVVVTGGSLVSGTLAERVRTHICSNLIVAYGAAESTVVAAGPVQAFAHIPGATGYVAPNVAVETTGPSGNLLAPGTEGLIRIRSKFNASGYVGDPHESSLAFRDGAFCPGDMGYVTSGGLLVISGREKSVLNLGGDKINPERIERVLTSFPGITQAAAFSIVNRLGVDELCAVIVGVRVDEEALKGHCKRHLPGAFVPTRIAAADHLPMTAAGKLDRRKLPELVDRFPGEAQPDT